eukprot:CAMPEP_0205826722 /NCGR_PEP_ID=MMETSP0206-20130828/29644_1 /ASSEMBLY_ACC=CAM_ASM_000279 /TAXON_ID=36767 /ORGANISM="Euplotes focardii, Strain TN1" /LENGTH=60 /DNA_ID=CAMNT_0053126913 /DNA_START=35 /DNA_END=213 /DNA_ORIENTATION=-
MPVPDAERGFQLPDGTRVRPQHQSPPFVPDGSIGYEEGLRRLAALKGEAAPPEDLSREPG